MSDDGNGKRNIELTRRTFTQTIGGAALLAAAVDPAMADRKRGTARVEDTARLTPIETGVTPAEWDIVGPFQYQRRDVEIGWLFPEGGTDAFSTGEKLPAPAPDQRFQSAFAGGATVEWGSVTADGDTVPLDFSQRIDPTKGGLTPLTGGDGLFDDFHDFFGVGGVLFSVGYAFATIERNAPTRAVLETDASVVWVNGQRYEGGPAGVVLQEGTNYLLAKASLTLGRGSVSLTFRPPRAPVEINELDAFRGTPQNVLLPDLRVGEQTKRPASVRVTNTTGEAVTDATLMFAPDSDLLVTQREKIDPPLAPFETRRINTRVQTKGPVTPQMAATAAKQSSEKTFAAQDISGDDDRRGIPPGISLASTFVSETLNPSDAGPTDVSVAAADYNPTVVARLEVGGTATTREIPLRLRESDVPKWQSTFVSAVDGSVQTLSILEPPNPDSPGAFDLLVSLHGASVPSINQASANIQHENTYVVAPGTRGPVNYDHEDLGRLDDLEALRVMKERYNIDDTHVFLSGHSMGGHGTWHVGLTNPQHWAGLAPSAGWTDHETYLIVPFMRDKLWTHPRIKAVKEAALYKNLALPKTENAMDGTLPTFALHGGEDTSVPTLHPRTYARGLANLGLVVNGEVGRRYSNPNPDAVDVALLEVPGQGHYWEAGIGPGNDSINHPDMLDFLFSTERDSYPNPLHFYTTNLRIEHEKDWVAVLQQEQVHAPTRITAEVTGDGITVETENVEVFSLDLRVLQNVDVNASARLTVAGETVRLPGRGGAQPVYVDLRDGVSASRSPPRFDSLRKSPEQYGPLKEIHQSDYVLVYGTQGNDAETTASLNMANLRSQRLVERARSQAIVLPDTAVDRKTMREHTLILFGTPSSNAVINRLMDGFPLSVRDGVVDIAGHTYTGDLGVQFIYPNPEAPDNLVQVDTGTSLPGARLTRVRNFVPTQKGTPDYQVYDDRIRYRNWDASLAAGFFDNHWEVDPGLGVLRETT